MRLNIVALTTLSAILPFAIGHLSQYNSFDARDDEALDLLEARELYQEELLDLYARDSELFERYAEPHDLEILENLVQRRSSLQRRGNKCPKCGVNSADNVKSSGRGQIESFRCPYCGLIQRNKHAGGWTNWYLKAKGK